mgnify:CR=1 FL=1
MTETLNSVKNQSYPDWECIIVDDGSNDGSQEIAKGFCEDTRFHFLERDSSKPKGANACRNIGAEKATGEALLFLDGDDLLSEDCLKHRLELMQNENLFVYNSGVFEAKISNSVPFFPALNKGLNNEDYLGMFLEYITPWNIHSPIWKKAFFLELGGFDEELQRFQDVDLHIRALSNNNLKIGFDRSDIITSFYRKSEFHQKMTLEKRRFLLDQGLIFADKISTIAAKDSLKHLQGLLIYLHFRFEEVFAKDDSKRIERLVSKIKEDQHDFKISRELRYLQYLFENLMIKASKLRKALSYGAFRLYSKQKREYYLA